MPTTRPRHTITETPPVQEELDRLRAELGSDRIDYAELLVLGSREKRRQLERDSEMARAARRRLAAMILDRSGPEPDIAAADEVKTLGLIANYE